MVETLSGRGPTRRSVMAGAAALAVSGQARAQGAGLDGLHNPARLLLLAVYGVLGARVAHLAARVVARARPSI